MFDYAQFIFWCLTYLLIIIYGLLKNKVLIPICAVVLNFSWELTSLFYDLLRENFTFILIHTIWLILDFFICIIIFKNDKINRKKLLIILPSFVILFEIFKLNNGQLISCFMIDLIMAYLFLFKIIKDKADLIGQLILGFLKLLGDLFAWFAYLSMDFVLFVGLLVLILNSIYIIISFIKINVDSKRR